jgi:tetratricopeptide (TPR) repeat protein
MNIRPTDSGQEIFQKLMKLYSEGIKLMDEKNYVEATGKFTEGIGTDGHFSCQNVTQYAQRARCYMHLQRYIEAISDLYKAIKLEPDFHHGEYYFLLACCYDSGFRDRDYALACFTKAIELNPDNLEAYYRRGLIYFEENNKREALEDLEFVLSRDRSYDRVCINLRKQLRDELGIEPANDDPEFFPGEPIPRFSDYVNFMKKLQAGDVVGALSEYNLDMVRYESVTQLWRSKLAADPVLSSRFSQFMAE